MEEMNLNILLAINKQYKEQAIVLIYSILKSNKEDNINLYIMHRSLSYFDEKEIINRVGGSKCKMNFIKIDSTKLKKLPVYQKRYPLEIYFRLYAANYLPEDVDRILYLDADTLVINGLNNLYNMDFENNYFIATTHVGKLLKGINNIRLDLDKEDKYINTGVMLMNIKELRKVDIEKEISKFLKNNNLLLLPDQDIISQVFGKKIKLVDANIYNFGEREWNKHNIKNPNKPIDLRWIRKNTVIIHYYGKNKPWNENYIGNLNIFYNRIKNNMERGNSYGKQTV
jgi:lipopolysaccharide biosynthesis glycosyltransferase